MNMSTERIVVIVCFLASLVGAGTLVLLYRGDEEIQSAPVAVAQATIANSAVLNSPLSVEPMETPPPAEEAKPEAVPVVTDDGPPMVTVTDTVVVPNVKRFGINLGGRSQYGASQIIKNIIPNPGFEAGVYGSMLHVEKGATGERLPQAFWYTDWNVDNYGIGQPEGFWNGADYEIVFGPAKGRTGKVKRFALENNHNVFYLDKSGTAPLEYDVFIVRQKLPGLAAGPRMETSSVDTTTVRPGSPGKQSLRLKSSGPWYLFLDSYWRDGDTTAGKLLLVEGPWTLSFWAKGEDRGSRLHIRFQRDGEAVFIDQSVPLSAEWKQYTLSFDAPKGMDRYGGYSESDYHAILTLGISVEAGGAWLDDMSLSRTDYTNPTVFIDPLVEKYKELRPGILRDWASQLGDTLDNQLAEPWARKQVGFSPRYRAANDYCYSFPEFLQLCALVGAEPWYVIPPTFSPQDCLGLIEYLAGPADGNHPYADRRAALGHKVPWTDTFAKIHLEFGNEMWGAASGGDPFFGASALGGARLGAIAGDRFTLMKSSPDFRPESFDLIIGGQYYFPGRQAEIEEHSTAHNSIALAPYFGVLTVYDTVENRYYPLFARAFEDVTTGKLAESQGYLTKGDHDTAMAVYELNFHTTGGDQPSDVRNDFVTGADGALALPLYMLEYLRAFGVRNQCAFLTLQYSFDMGNKNFVRLWGLLRDIAATGRERPTWLGLELVNRIVGGDMVETHQSGAIPVHVQEPMNGVEHETSVPLIQSYAFHNGSRWGLVLFNLNLEDSLSVGLDLPGKPAGDMEVFRIAPDSLSDDNEDERTVTIEPVSLDSPGIPESIELPPHSLTGLTWSTS